MTLLLQYLKNCTANYNIVDHALCAHEFTYLYRLGDIINNFSRSTSPALWMASNLSSVTIPGTAYMVIAWSCAFASLGTEKLHLCGRKKTVLPRELCNITHMLYT